MTKSAVAASPLPRLRAAYFCYLAGVGIMVTYLPYRMDAIGLTAAEIGLIFTGRTVLSATSGPMISVWSDRTGRTLAFLRTALVLGFLIGCGLPFAVGFATMAAVIWLQSPFVSATVPLIDATIVRHSGELGFGSSRLWGSVGYGLAVLGFGLAVRNLDYALAGELAILAYLALAAATAISGASLRRDETKQPRARSGAIRSWLKNPAFVAFLVVNALHWSTMMMWNVFFSLHVKALDLGPAIPGIAVFIMICGEVVGLAWAGRVLANRPAEKIIIPAFIITALRWLVTAYAVTAAPLVLVQCLHLISFGLWNVALLRVLGRYAEPEARAGAQGLLNAVVYGLGGVLGTALGGVLMQEYGGRVLFITAACIDGVALIGFIAVLRMRGYRPHGATPGDPTGSKHLVAIT